MRTINNNSISNLVVLILCISGAFLSHEVRADLVTACEQGDLDQVTTYLKSNADPNQHDSLGRFPLTEAVHFKDSETGATRRESIVRELLDNGADPNAPGALANLMEAAMKHSEEVLTILRVMLDWGDRPYRRSKGIGATPLRQFFQEFQALKRLRTEGDVFKAASRRGILRALLQGGAKFEFSRAELNNSDLKNDVSLFVNLFAENLISLSSGNQVLLGSVLRAGIMAESGFGFKVGEDIKNEQKT